MAKKKKEVGLESPWCNFYKKVWNVLTRDPELKVTDLVETGSGDYEFNVESSNAEKIIALSKIIKNNVEFGNVSVSIKFLVTNAENDEEPTIEDYQTAFEGNELFCEIQETSLYDFVIFNRDIISFYDDNLCDYCLNTHMIAADMAREISNEVSGISFCTLAAGDNEE